MVALKKRQSDKILAVLVDVRYKLAIKNIYSIGKLFKDYLSKRLLCFNQFYLRYASGNEAKYKLILVYSVELAIFKIDFLLLVEWDYRIEVRL